MEYFKTLANVIPDWLEILTKSAEYRAKMRVQTHSVASALNVMNHRMVLNAYAHPVIQEIRMFNVMISMNVPEIRVEQTVFASIHPEASIANVDLDTSEIHSWPVHRAQKICAMIRIVVNAEQRLFAHLGLSVKMEDVEINVIIFLVERKQFVHWANVFAHLVILVILKMLSKDVIYVANVKSTMIVKIRKFVFNLAEAYVNVWTLAVNSNVDRTLFVYLAIIVHHAFAQKGSMVIPAICKLAANLSKVIDSKFVRVMPTVKEDLFALLD